MFKKRSRKAPSPNSILIQEIIKLLLIIALTCFLAIEQSQAYQPLEIQLANKYHKGIKVEDYFISEKLDGVRAYWNGEKFLSKSGKPIRTPRGYTQHFPKQHLEGELWIGRNQFDITSAATRQKAPDEKIWRKIKFMVFDMPQHKGTFSQRLKAMKTVIANSKSKNLKLIEQFKLPDHASVMQKLKTITQKGGEGLMLHKADAHYKTTRNNNLLKLKPYHDAEATVIAHVPGKGKFKGMMGSILVRSDNGTEFRIAIGFKIKDRKTPPPIGSQITYKYTGQTKTGKPKFPVFLRLKP